MFSACWLLSFLRINKPKLVLDQDVLQEVALSVHQMFRIDFFFCSLLQQSFIVVCIASVLQLHNRPTESLNPGVLVSQCAFLQLGAAKSHTGLPANPIQLQFFLHLSWFLLPPRLVPPVIPVNYAGSWAGCQTA